LGGWYETGIGDCIGWYETGIGDCIGWYEIIHGLSNVL